MRTIEEVKNAFQPVPAKLLDPGQTQRVLKLQNILQETAEEILDLVPECADRTHAIRQVLDAKFWCVQAITHYGPTIKAQGTALKTQPPMVSSEDQHA